MASEPPCTACSWSTSRQDAGHYHSHIKVFYSASDRAVWSLGPKYMFKERSNEPPSFEGTNLRFLKDNTTIPIPKIILDYSSDGRYYIQTERIAGETLETAWTTLSSARKVLIAQQTAAFLSQLRKLQSPRMQSLGEQPLYSSFLFRDDFGQSHGPLSSDAELWTIWEPTLRKLPVKARTKFRERMPSSGPYTFTHGDLFIGNIIVENGHLAGIIDWESSGYFPVWWEFTCAGIGLGEADAEWKGLLREHMVQHEASREFWLDLRSLSAYPDLNERGVKVLAQLLHD